MGPGALFIAAIAFLVAIMFLPNVQEQAGRAINSTAPIAGTLFEPVMGLFGVMTLGLIILGVLWFVQSKA